MPGRITTADDFAPPAAGDPARPATWALHTTTGALERFGMPLGEPKGEVVARVDHGRWIADCATPGCNGALVVSPTDRRFFCPLCGNDANKGRWLAVVFPRNRSAVEEALLERPLAITRNWNPGETPAGLREEQVAMEVVERERRTRIGEKVRSGPPATPVALGEES